MYKHVDQETLDYLVSITSKDRVLAGDEISVDYSHDELGDIFSYPEVLVRVKTAEEISRIMRYANEHMIPVVVRGSGTGLVGGAVALHGGIMIETLAMNRILELDADNLTVTVEPGVLLMELAAFAEENDFLYPPDPGEKSATIGGNISTNAGGMRAVHYGVTRDYVRALEVVLPNGEIVNFGGKIVKASTGYSLKDLIIGAEGTLGVVTKATLKLIPKPQVSLSVLIPFESIKAAIETVPVLVRNQLPLTAIEFFEQGTIRFAEEYLGKRFPDSSSSAYLLLTMDGENKDSVMKGLFALADKCFECGAKDVFLVDTEERKKSVWSARGAFLEAIKASTTEMDECDVVVPRNRVAEFILYSHEVAKDLNIRIPSFGHAGDGNLHLYICRDDLDEKTWKEKLAEAFRLLYAKSAQLQGLVSGEHGIGFAKKDYMQALYGDEIIGLMRGIKAVFDPNCILNPGKLF